MAETIKKHWKALRALLVLAPAHFLLPLRWGDDAVFFEKVRRLGLFDFLKASSRLLVDSLTYLFA
ncbi:MAG: hypothetical protein LBB75_07890, partial [Oscillospiraceae bacterium]|nr:hypothetical protein [Oscillospiraceae bacterium]